MARPTDQMSEDQIEAELANFDHHRLSSDPVKQARFEKARPRYLELLEASSRFGRLEVKRTLAFILSAARDRRFVSYGEIAQANGLVWSFEVRHRMNGHLWDVIRTGHDQGLPILSAIVVNKENLDTGAMAPETLVGFIRASENLGYKVDDPEVFLLQQQTLIFERFAKM